MDKSPINLTSVPQSGGLDVPKLPDTRTGIKLKQKLLQDESVINVKNIRKLGQLNMEEKSLVLASYELFNSIDIQAGISQTRALYSIFNIIDNILNYPYSDEQRILNIMNFSSSILKQQNTVKFLQTLGFEPSISPEILVLPYDKPIKRLMVAREALVSKLSSKIETVQLADVEGKLGFPTFQRFSELFGVDLSEKTAKSERESIMLTQQEVMTLIQETECRSIEEYIVELGENANEFQLVFMDSLGKSNKAKDILMVLRELWLEVNVLHKTAVFLRQCFADPVSRAPLTDAKDKNSKFARNILMIDIMDAQGIRKGTKGRANTIEQLVLLYCERETYKIQNFPDQVQKIDNQIRKGIGGESSISTDKLWDVVKTIIIERLTRKPKLKRPSVAQPKLLEWVECMDPEIELADLHDYSKERIEDLDELVSLITKRNLERQRMFGDFSSKVPNSELDPYNTGNMGKLEFPTNSSKERQNGGSLDDRHLDERIYEAIWSPTTWLHQKQLIDDFVIFTVMSEICNESETEFIFNIRQCFRNFMMENMPNLEVTRDGQASEFSSQKKKDQTKKSNLDQYLDQAWKHLYRNSSPNVLHATIFNSHFDYMKQYVERGVDINAKDFNEWTPLHCAAYMGNVLYLKHMLSRPYIFLHEKNDEGKTPIQVAIEASNVFGEENAVTCLLERGTELEEDIWHRLLILAYNYDIVSYPKLAFRAGINLNNCGDETKVSLHKAVCCLSVKIIKFYGEALSQQELTNMIKQSDFQGLNVQDYAKLTENQEIITLIEKMSNGEGIQSHLVTRDNIEALKSKSINNESRLQFSDRNSEINENITHQIDKFDGSGDKYRNDEWRRRDFDDDYIKNVQEQHLKELKDAQSRLLEKDTQVESLQQDLRQQSEKMMKLQEEINNLFNEQKTHRHDEARYLKKELRDMNKNFNNQINALQSNIEQVTIFIQAQNRKTTNNLQEMQGQQQKAYEDFNKLQKTQKDLMKKLLKDRNNQLGNDQSSNMGKLDKMSTARMGSLQGNQSVNGNNNGQVNQVSPENTQKSSNCKIF
ncbi:UNKNOWN [Stylonychia lemnae]|uniref:Uncharacterized protein n=1 Tax=Stylonychia lemnae TaxID=5949 RepID=A0A078AW62_STYLE|nr:UNKNOWN [Stylonychia lemnae]|eukprot:CDW85033.1 UNKNOWN [Stylonychia lemnae]